MQTPPGDGKHYDFGVRAPEHTGGGDGFGIAAIVLASAGLLGILPLVGSGLAIYFAGLSEREHGSNEIARIGRILGWVGLVVWILIVLAFILLLVAVSSHSGSLTLTSGG